MTDWQAGCWSGRRLGPKRKRSRELAPARLFLVRPMLNCRIQTPARRCSPSASGEYNNSVLSTSLHPWRQLDRPGSARDHDGKALLHHSLGYDLPSEELNMSKELNIMTESTEIFITVRRQWNDWKEARYRLCDIERLHWTEVDAASRSQVPEAA
jgi:hypothetical protein